MYQQPSDALNLEIKMRRCPSPSMRCPVSFRRCRHRAVEGMDLRSFDRPARLDGAGKTTQ
jgi:hypothetical protein